MHRGLPVVETRSHLSDDGDGNEDRHRRDRPRQSAAVGHRALETRVIRTTHVRRRRRRRDRRNHHGRRRGRSDIDILGSAEDGASKFGDAVVAVGDFGSQRTIERRLELFGPRKIRTHLGERARARGQSPNERLLRRELRIG